MFTAVLIVHDDLAFYRLHRALLDSGVVQITNVVQSPKHVFDIHQAFGGAPVDFVFIDMANTEALALAAEVKECEPAASVIAVNPEAEPEALEQAGFAGVITLPATTDRIESVLRRVARNARGGVEPKLLAFLPAKAGVGCTTVALNAALALAGPLGKRVLVIECDLRAGTLAILLNRKPQVSLQKALQMVDEVDRFRWNEWVTQAHGADFLLSDLTTPERLPRWTDYFALLKFATPQYDFVIVDLPELINPATAEAVSRARYVFEVTTQELAPMRLAQRRSEELGGWGVEPERVKLLLNRYHRDQIGVEELEKLVGYPVFAKFPNDYVQYHKAILSGQPLRWDSPSGRAFIEFASQVAGTVPPASKPGLGRILQLLGGNPKPAAAGGSSTAGKSA